MRKHNIIHIRLKAEVEQQERPKNSKKRILKGEKFPLVIGKTDTHPLIRQTTSILQDLNLDSITEIEANSTLKFVLNQFKKSKKSFVCIF